ncbi:MAG TPA: response regulator transcription factor [Thermoleophilaceae bacterium]|nr:response regulator transcription factor [Thermoleophilaceae bacterium]
MAVKVESPANPLRIAVADDHAVVREGIRLLLDAEADLTVVAEADDSDGALRAVRGHKPDVLVLDLSLRESDALDAIPAIKADAPETAIIVLTMHGDATVAREVMRAGAAGFLLKDSAGEELVRAVRAVAEGSTYVQPDIGGQIAALDTYEPNRLREISEREVEVLRLVALGHTSREVADMLVLSVRTVETHRRHLQEKLECETRAELVRFAIDHGLLETRS